MGVKYLFKFLLILLIILCYSTAYSESSYPDIEGPIIHSIVSEANGSDDGILPDGFSGSLNRSIVLNIPAGINDMQPSLRLSYNSRNSNGWLGVGWDLPFGVIVLNSKGKLEHIDSTGNHELIATDTNGNYSYKIVQEFNRIKKIGVYWEITNTKGIKYYYGSSTRLNDKQNVTVKWYLDKIVDPFGNYILINYDTSKNQINPLNIQYTGNEISGLSPKYTISFINSSRSDNSISYKYGAKEQLNRRLESIRIMAGSTLIRSYQLTYQAAPYRVSILQSVDEVSNLGDKMLVESFKYTQNGNSFTLMQNTISFNDGTNPLSYFIADVNGDGLSDIVYVSPVDSKIRVALAKKDGNGFEPPTTWKTGLGDGKKEKYRFVDVNGDGKADLIYFHVDNEQQSSAVCLSDGASSFGSCANINAPTEGTGSFGVEQFKIADVTGDGKSDIMHLNYKNNQALNVINVSPSMCSANSVSFGPYTTAVSVGFGYPNRYIYADFDGDGIADKTYLDRVVYVSCAFGSCVYYRDGILHVSTKNNTPNDWGTIGFGNVYSYRIADFNGDGKSDVLFIERYNRAYTGLSTGKSFVGSDGSSRMNMNITDGSYVYDLDANKKFLWGTIGNIIDTYNNYFIGDYNGDGKSDILWVSSNGLYVAQSNGFGFTTKTGEALTTNNMGAINWGHLGDGNAERYRVGDFNGDGKSDVLFIAADGTISVMTSSGSFDNLLNQIETRQGGIIDIHYTSSTRFSNTQLPFALPVVDSITTNDGNPLKQQQNIGTSTTTFTYSGGYYSFSEREFRGFKEVTVEAPAGPNNERSITTTMFHQGDSRSASIADDASVSDAFMRGKPYNIRTSDANGAGYVEKVINYIDSNQLPHFNPPADITINECISASTCKSSKTSFTYDIYGNVTRKEIQPDLEETTHNQTIVREFNPNTTAWIVSLPSSETLYAGLGTLNAKAKTEYFYDAAASCQAVLPTYPAIPALNKVTGIRQWLENGTSPETRMAYDAYGNKVCEKDPRTDKTIITTYVYDPVYHSYLKEIKPPANLIPSTTFVYYGIDVAGNGFGQLKSVTDANNKTTTIQYDAFGRKLRTDYPDQTWEQITYTDHSSTNGIGIQNVRVDNSAGLWTVSYFDGMNRVFTTESLGAEGKTIVRDTVFDARNKPYMTSYPYIKNIDTRLWNSTVARDYLGRVINSVKPGNSGNVGIKNCYGLRSVDTLDENGHLKRKSFNGIGLVSGVDEFIGKYTDCSEITATPYARTTYEYDVLGHLTRVTDGKPLVPNVSSPNVTNITYDTLGRKKSNSDPDMGLWQYTYYPNGLLQTTKDAKDQVITYYYDELNRLTTKRYPTGPDVTYIYDEATSTNPKGRLTKMTDSAGQTVYNYDTMGRITGKKVTIDGVSYQLAFGYLNGRLDSITYPDNEVVSYTYTGNSLQKAGNYVYYQNFDAFGRPWSAAYGAGGASSLFTYDQVTKRLATLSTLSPAQGLLIDNEYGYDDKGNITSITDKLNISLPLNLTGETYVTARAHALARTGSGRIFQLDPNGNVTSDGVRTITYNYDNMPLTVNSTSFTYNGNGQRVKKNNTVYIDKYYECTNGTCSKYIYAGNSRVAINTGGVKLFYHPDHQGSTAVVTNALGGKEERIAYYPFGGTRQDEVNIINLKHKYTAQELDSETGLYNYNARLYDPELGRFISPDSIVPNPLNPQSMNRYAYVQNNPINFTDPTGHEAEGDTNSSDSSITFTKESPNSSGVTNNRDGTFSASFDAVWGAVVSSAEKVGSWFSGWGDTSPGASSADAAVFGTTYAAASDWGGTSALTRAAAGGATLTTGGAIAGIGIVAGTVVFAMPSSAGDPEIDLLALRTNPNIKGSTRNYAKPNGKSGRSSYKGPKGPPPSDFEKLYWALMTAAGTGAGQGVRTGYGQDIFKYSYETIEAFMPGPPNATIPGQIKGVYDAAFDFGTYLNSKF